MAKLEELCALWRSAKEQERQANSLRVQFEEEILAITGCPSEGSEIHEAPGFNIRVEQRINRKIDSKKWELVKEHIPEALRPVSIVEEWKVETKGVYWLRDNEPGYYKLLCSAMEEKPAKPSVKIEVQHEDK